MASHTPGLWHHPAFLRLWAAQSVSLLGTGLGALPFTAILFLHASGTEMAILTGAITAPGLVLGLAAGSWADRVRRRPLLIAADLGRAAALASLPIAAAFGALAMPQLYAVAFITGSLTVVFDVAHLSYVPSLVSREQLVEANSKLAASASIAEAGSFSLGGWLVQLFGALTAVVADACSFLVSACFLLSIRGNEPPPARDAAPEAGVLAGLAAGARVALADGRLAGLLFASAATSIADGIIGSVILLFGSRDLGLAPRRSG
ncbi:MAG: MFS transporter [Hyphomicrobiales bacterium]